MTVPAEFNLAVPQAQADMGLRPVRLWLYFTAFMVCVMVLVGGATRLTDSGLSITEWAPISGAIPPLSSADWALEFDRYKTTTEFQTINSAMTLAEFKVIFWWEWGHRFLGRLIGIVFAVPLIWFWLRGRLTAWLKPRLLFLLALGGLQGFIGWWMVRSGLFGRVDVAHERLAIHLTLACIILAYTLWLARSIRSHSAASVYGFGWQFGALLALLFAQIFIGGMLAGLDGGMAYNTWPDMNGAMVPDGVMSMTPWWMNYLHNTATIQFIHRLLAYALFFGVIVHAFQLHRSVAGTAHARRGYVLVALIFFQMCIGIVTLVLQVPMGWALLHQFGALVVLLMLVAHGRALTPRDAAFN